MRPPSSRHPATVATSRRLRCDATEAETALWRAIRHDALGVRFRRQHPIGPYFADFACVEARLVVELDGGQHGPERDAARAAAITAAGWHVARSWNNEVMQNLPGVLADLGQVVAERVGRAFPPP